MPKLISKKEIKTTKQFNNKLRNIIRHKPHIVDDVVDSIYSFLNYRHNPILNDKQLTEPLQNYRSFRINEDYRIHYKEGSEYFLFFDIGNHEELYGD